MTEQYAITDDRRRALRALSIGFALFSMFFGAGNLIFPLLIGRSVGSNAGYALIGLALTAVIMPFIGLISMVLFRGEHKIFFGRLGKIPSFILLAILLLILGPFGVIPRLISLMHAIITPYLWNLPLLPFSILMGGLLFLCSYRKEKLITFLGFLTPFLLLCISVLVMLGISTGSFTNQPTLSPKTSFLEGLVGGYNTMDLIAAFIFATAILPHFSYELKITDPKARNLLLLKKMAPPTLIAASLLFLTYCGLCLISALHGSFFEDSYPPEKLLNAIANKLLGPIGGFIAAIAVTLACLTTAVSLTSIFAEYLRKNSFKGRMNNAASLLITLSVTTFFANFGFQGISSFLSPILQIIYPGLILLTILNLSYTLFNYRTIKIPVFITFLFSSIYHFWH